MTTNFKIGDTARPLPALWSRSFKEAFCQKHRCSSDDYEQKVFWKSLYRHAVPITYLIYSMAPDFFKEDFDVIKEIGSVIDPKVFTMEIDRFYGRNVREKSWLRRVFLIRISGKRLVNKRTDLQILICCAQTTNFMILVSLG